MTVSRLFVSLCSILLLSACAVVEDAAFFIPEFDEERHALLTARLTNACQDSLGNAQECGGQSLPACLGNGCKAVRMGAVRDGSRCASFLNTVDEPVVLTVRTYWGESTRMLDAGEIYDFYFGPGCLTPDRVRSTIVFYRYD